MTANDTVPRSRYAVVWRLRRVLPLDSRDYRWLGLAVLPACIAVAVYLATNAYPAYGAGLYTHIANEIRADGYMIPTRIPGYTIDGIPFAYPPLQFYVFAIWLDLGGEPVILSRFLPGIAVVMAQIPIYVLAREHTGSRPAGATVAALVALNPQILEWHVSAGGVVRAFGFLYAMTAITAGYYAFTTGSRSAVVVGVFAFGVTVLTHPTYSLFVGVSCLLIWSVLDRSRNGFIRGAGIGLGGAAIASPWLAWVFWTHGPAVFTAASGTHGSIGGGLDTLTGAVTPYVTVLLVAAAYLLVVESEYFLPLWLISVELLFQQPRFAFTVGAFVLATTGTALIRRHALDSNSIASPDRRALLAALVLVTGSLAGGTYLAYEMTLPTDPSTPEPLDDEAMAAMDWVATESPADATFVVMGDVAEWFPALTDRTIVVGPWGVEWESASAFGQQLTAHKTISTCQNVTCVETTAAAVGTVPEYVYVSKGQYVVRGETAVQSRALEQSFEQSPRWKRVFENDGVVIYRIV